MVWVGSAEVKNQKSKIKNYTMSEIDRFRPDDRRGVDTLYRRTQGADAADASRLRWDWQHRRNPYNRAGTPDMILSDTLYMGPDPTPKGPETLCFEVISPLASKKK